MAIRVIKKVVAVIRRMVPGKYYTDSIIAAFVLLSKIVRSTHIFTVFPNYGEGTN